MIDNNVIDMPPPYFFNNFGFGAELTYSIVILIFSFLVYFKTRELYNLSKHRGIQFFRYAFMFFGLAYASRLLLYIMIISNTSAGDFWRHGRTILPISNLMVAYFSTLAILYLTYSIVWKKVNIEHFFIFSNIVALIVAVIAFVSRSPIIVSLIQLVLLIITVVITTITHRKSKKRSNLKVLYLLIAMFWLFNLFVLGPIRFLPFEVKLVFQLISVGVFIAIYYKVTKWVK